MNDYIPPNEIIEFANCQFDGSMQPPPYNCATLLLVRVEIYSSLAIPHDQNLVNKMLVGVVSHRDGMFSFTGCQRNNMTWLFVGLTRLFHLVRRDQIGQG
jgi:hypothetical protein